MPIYIRIDKNISLLGVVILAFLYLKSNSKLKINLCLQAEESNNLTVLHCKKKLKLQSCPAVSECQTFVFTISSFFDPKGTINHARDEGYKVADFVVVPLPFGYYNSEPKVKKILRNYTKRTWFFIQTRSTFWLVSCLKSSRNHRKIYLRNCEDNFPLILLQKYSSPK